MASLEDWKLERRILMLFDYDLTLTEEYQQIPLFKAFFDNIKKAYDGTRIPKRDEFGYLLVKDGKYVFETDEAGNERTITIEKPEDYFKIVDAWFPSNNGIGYLESIKRDVRRGVFPIKRSDLHSFGAQVQLSPGLPEFFHELKKEWDGKCYMKTVILSVGLRDMILGNEISKFVDEVHASDVFSINDPDGIEETYTNVTPFTKSENAIIFAKGGRPNLKREMHLNEMTFRYNNFICTGDGHSDVDHFAYTRKKGGTNFCVYKKGDAATFAKMGANEEVMRRVHYLIERDYTKGGEYWTAVNERIEKSLSSKCSLNKQFVDIYKKRKVGRKDCDEIIREHVLKEDCEECKFQLLPVRKIPPKKNNSPQ